MDSRSRFNGGVKARLKVVRMVQRIILFEEKRDNIDKILVKYLFIRVLVKITIFHVSTMSAVFLFVNL